MSLTIRGSFYLVYNTWDEFSVSADVFSTLDRRQVTRDRVGDIESWNPAVAKIGAFTRALEVRDDSNDEDHLCIGFVFPEGATTILKEFFMSGWSPSMRGVLGERFLPAKFLLT